MLRVLSILCLLCLSCNQRSSEDLRKAVMPTPEEALLAKTMYVKDTRTGLCFISSPSYGDNHFYSLVPCSPEVEKLLVK